MGNTQSSTKKVNYEDMQYILKNREKHVLINTLNKDEQDCLLPNTLDVHKEEEFINELLNIGRKDVKIIIYGKNANDETIYKKYNQLTSLGFNTYVYLGGLFEWLMLQDIYNDIDFPTTKKELDILKFRPRKTLDVHYLKY